MKIGIIGCGNISGCYIQYAFKLRHLELIALADLDVDRAKIKVAEIQQKAEEWKLPAGLRLPVACSVDELLGNPEIQLVINLTIPKAHAQVAIATLEAGKHTYGEKPIGVNREEARKILQVAKSKNLRVGNAPDTFLGAGLQTCRKIIDDGLIGQPVGATAFMTCPGHESWHPDPAFYYQKGGGPMLDMGPYYLTALVNLVGPVQKVAGINRITYPERTITSAPKKGTKIKVETPTHMASTLEFANGAIGTMLMSFDVQRADLPHIQIFGTQGTLMVPDPNDFGGRIRLWKSGNEKPEWCDVPQAFANATNSRGLGVADMAAAIPANRPHRASGELAYHVLDVMQATLEAGETGRHISIESHVDRPASLPDGLPDGAID